MALVLRCGPQDPHLSPFRPLSFGTVSSTATNDWQTHNTGPVPPSTLVPAASALKGRRSIYIYIYIYTRTHTRTQTILLLPLLPFSSPVDVVAVAPAAAARGWRGPSDKRAGSEAHRGRRCGRGRGAYPTGARGSVAGQERNYGDLVDSDEVHDEIRALGRQVSEAVRTYLPQNGTSRGQVMSAVRAFGPSAQSKRILNRENEAAIVAHRTGTYTVWRCLPERVGGAGRESQGGRGAGGGDRFTHGAHKMLSGANDDYCARVGPASLCFCQHSLSAHATPEAGRGAKKGRGGYSGGAEGLVGVGCTVSGCSCRCYRFIPNTPEEIGEGWLTRRREWDPEKWSPKCRCGHGARSHDAHLLSCRECGCGQYNSHFLCVVCDQPWEAHITVAETEAERLAAGRPVREDFFPLADVDWDVRELVLADPTGGGALTAPSSSPQVEQQSRLSIEGPPRRGTRSTTPRRKQIGAGATTATAAPAGPPEDAGVLPPFCTRCATIFRTDESKFCSKCGAPRGRRT